MLLHCFQDEEAVCYDCASNNQLTSRRTGRGNTRNISVCPGPAPKSSQLWKQYVDATQHLILLPTFMFSHELKYCHAKRLKLLFFLINYTIFFYCVTSFISNVCKLVVGVGGSGRCRLCGLRVLCHKGVFDLPSNTPCCRHFGQLFANIF